MKITLTEKERIFIALAILHKEGVFDYENFPDKFEEYHGMTADESYQVADSLSKKIKFSTFDNVLKNIT